MRNLAIRLVLWLCDRFDINPIAEQRLLAPSDKVERGQRWEQFYNEHGGLRDMIQRIRQSYFEQASAVGHRDNDKLYEFAVADRQARELEREVLQIIATGKATAEKARYDEREEAARILRAI